MGKEKIPQRQLDSVKESPNISQENKDLLEPFDNDLITEDYSNERRYKNLLILKKLAKEADFAFDEADEDDLRTLVAWINKQNLSDAYSLDHKIVLKRFYRWINNRVWGNKDEHPDITSFISTAGGQTNGKLPKELLTPEDVDALIDAANNSRDKALIGLLWETGARYSELMDLTVGDVEDRKRGRKIVVHGKNGGRRIPLMESVPYLNRWLSDHPNPEKDSPRTYVHLSGRDLDNTFDQMHGSVDGEEEEKEEKVDECPRCSELYKPGEDQFCSNCGQAFDLEAAEKVEKVEEKASEEMLGTTSKADLMQEMQEMRQELAELKAEQE